MQDFAATLRYTLRQFRLAPVFTGAAILTLALGIGGTTAIFTLIHAVMLESLPVANPASLYRIGDGNDCCVEGGPQDNWGMFPYRFFQVVKTETPEFAELTAFQAGQGRMSVRRSGTNTPARPLRSEYVAGNYFDTFGVKALSGRLINVDDDRASAPPVAVLSHQCWQSIYGSDPSLVGAILEIEGHPFTIAGVAPAGFFGDTLRSDPPDIWIPLEQETLVAGVHSSLNRSPFSAWLRVIGRLKPGANTTAVGPRLTTLLHNWMLNDAGYPAVWMNDVRRLLPKQTIHIVPAGGGVASMKDDYGRSLNILMAVCGTVLLIACANVANLLLARAAQRRGQTALRLAIGASRKKIIAQAIAEAILLALAGGFTGLLVAILASRLLLHLAFHSAHFLPISVTPSPLVLLFAITVSLVTGITFGAAPAWFATRTDPIEALRGAGRSTRDNSSFARQALLVFQAALSVVLIAGAVMLARSLNKLEHQNFGYATTGRVVVSLNNPPNTYDIPKLMSLYRQIEEAMRQVPGVSGTGLAMYNPLTDNWGELIVVKGHPVKKLSEDAGSSWDRVTANYLQNFNVSLVRGRYFTPQDTQHSGNVAIINQAFAKRFFRNDEDPVDQYFGIDLPENSGSYRIVGIVRDAKFAGFNLNQPARPMFYVPLNQTTAYANTMLQSLELQSHRMYGLALVTKMPPGALEPQIVRILANIDPNLTINSVRSIEEQVALSFDQDRAVSGLAALFGVVALLLAAVGLYGVTAYTVAQRTNEIGIRMALGADRPGVVGYVLRGALTRVAIGLALGLPLAVLAGKLIATQLYGVAFFDPPALGLATISLAFAAIIAAIIPAVSAASISPLLALRVE